MDDSPIFMAIFCDFFSAKKIVTDERNKKNIFLFEKLKLFWVFFITNEKTGNSAFFRKENTCFDEL